MRQLLLLILVISFFSCDKQLIENKILNESIEIRIEILKNSFKHKIYSAYNKTIDYDAFHKQINYCIAKTRDNSLSTEDIDDINNFIKGSLEILNCTAKEIPPINYSNDKIEMINQFQLTELLILDKIIFQERNVNNNFSNLRAIICPISENTPKVGQEYDANIYLTSWDSLFEPRIKIMTPTGLEELHLVDSCVGKYRSVIWVKGKNNISGEIELKNELGQTIHLPFQHEFFVE